MYPFIPQSFSLLNYCFTHALINFRDSLNLLFDLSLHLFSLKMTLGFAVLFGVGCWCFGFLLGIIGRPDNIGRENWDMGRTGFGSTARAQFPSRFGGRSAHREDPFSVMVLNDCCCRCCFRLSTLWHKASFASHMWMKLCFPKSPPLLSVMAVAFVFSCSRACLGKALHAHSFPSGWRGSWI